MNDTVVRLIKLPPTTKGFVLDSPDGTHNVYLNGNLCYEMQRETYLHELRHIERGHLYSEGSVAEMEKETGQG